MLRVYKYFWILSVLLLNLPLHAQDEDTRQYLIKNLSFFYVETPNDTLKSYYILDNEEIAKEDTATICGKFWKDLNMENAKALVRGLLGTPENGGDLTLQHYAKKVCQIQDKPVQIWLYNDADSLNKFAMQAYNPCIDSEGYIWPCANSYEEDDKEFDNWAGYMHLGSINMNYFGPAWTKETFLHELMHTQDHSNIKAHIFRSYMTDKWFHYGSDEDHYVAEAVPSLTSAYKEGIANTISMLYDEKEAQQTFKWFANNDYLLVETTYDSTAATEIPAKAWLYHRIRQTMSDDGDALSGKELSHDKIANYKGYKIQDLLPKFIIHNENIIALIFSRYVKYVNLDSFLDAVFDVNLADPSVSPLSQIFKTLCEAGLPEDQTVYTVRKLPSDTPKPYLLPLAYADYLTGYTALDKQEFSEIFEEELPQPWIDLYWETAMEDLRYIIPLDKETTFDDLESVARALDIHPENTP